MNPARFGEWELDQIDALVALGAPRDAATRIIGIAKVDALRAARDAEDDRQFVMEYKDCGSRKMGERYGKSREWARDRFNKLIAQENPQEKLAPDLRAA